jgi:uncharacterized protein (TIGR00255 family)
MALKSMTGFGRSVEAFKDKKITIEIKSLNSKGLDLFCRISPSYREKEIEIRNLLSKKLERGKVELTIYNEESTDSKQSLVNRDLFMAYHQELKFLSHEISESSNNLLPLILKMPDILKNDKIVLEEEEWNFLEQLLQKAIHEIDDFRLTEGKTLENEIEERINLILDLLRQIENLDAERTTNIKNRIKNNLSEIIGAEKIDENRFEQELIYYIEKLDITEEKTRLKTHCNFFLENIKEASTGRKLAFISQEIGREINTIGSKANNAPIQKIVVLMKDELEKIKEQLNNIL